MDIYDNILHLSKTEKRLLLLFLLGEIFISVFICVYYADYIYVLPLAILAGVCFYLSLKYPMFYVVCVILLHIRLLWEYESEHSLVKTLIGVYIYGLLFWWFFQKLFIDREKIIRSTVDFALLFLVAMGIFSLVLAVINRSSLRWWVQESMLLSTYLLYFPVRDAIREKKHLVIVIVAFIVLGAVLAIKNLLRYISKFALVEYFWEIAAARQSVNEMLFATGLVVASAFLLSSTSLRDKIFSALLSAFFGITLILTFRRGYWIATLFAFVLMFVLVSAQQKKAMILYSGVFAVLVVSFVFLLFKDYGKLVVESISRRFLSAENIGGDVSLRARMVEAKTLLSWILPNPMIGYGLGAEFHFFETLRHITVQRWFSHNSYLHILFKLGIVGLTAFLYINAAFFRRGYVLLKSQLDKYSKALVLGILCIILLNLLMGFTEPQFLGRHSVVVISFAWGIIGALYRDREELAVSRR